MAVPQPPLGGSSMISRMARGQRGLVWLAAVLTAAVFGPHLFSQDRPREGEKPIVVVGGREAVANEVIVKFNRPVSTPERNQLEYQLDANSEPLNQSMQHFRSRSYDVDTMLSFLKTEGAVAFAEPNYIVH